MLSSVFYIVALIVISQFMALKIARWFLIRIQSDSNPRYRMGVFLAGSLINVIHYQLTSDVFVMWSVAFYFFITLFIVLDSAESILPKEFTMPFIIIGFLYITLHKNTIAPAVITAALICIVLLLFRRYVNKRAESEAFGLGDVYLMSGLGLWFSWSDVACIFLIATVIAWGYIKIQKINGVPFSPYLCSVAAIWPIINKGW